jgi:hypothetical protein
MLPRRLPTPGVPTSLPLSDFGCALYGAVTSDILDRVLRPARVFSSEPESHTPCPALESLLNSDVELSPNAHLFAGLAIYA